MADDTIPLRELRNHTSEVLRRVESGEHLVVTVDRRPVAELNPLPARRRWVSSARLWDSIRGAQADPALAGELDDLFDTRVGE